LTTSQLTYSISYFSLGRPRAVFGGISSPKFFVATGLCGSNRFVFERMNTL